MKYFAFAYQSGRTTTTGTPNIHTGRYNIAGLIAVFSKKSDRDNWVRYGDAKPLTAAQARAHCFGMSVSEYNELVEMILDISPRF